MLSKSMAHVPHNSFNMPPRNVVLKDPFFEDVHLFDLESLLGRCVSDMKAPTDSFAPKHDVRLNEWLRDYITGPQKIKFKEYLRLTSDQNMEAKITELFSATHRTHQGSEVDLDTTETLSLDLIQLPDAYQALYRQSNWLQPVEALCRQQTKSMAYWIVGITIATGSKIKTTEENKVEITITSTLPVSTAVTAAVTAAGVPPIVVPPGSLDVALKDDKTKNLEDHKEVESTGRCLLSLRYARVELHTRNPFAGRNLEFEGVIPTVRAEFEAVKGPRTAVEHFMPPVPELQAIFKPQTLRTLQRPLTPIGATLLGAKIGETSSQPFRPEDPGLQKLSENSSEDQEEHGGSFLTFPSTTRNPTKSWRSSVAWLFRMSRVLKQRFRLLRIRQCRTISGSPPDSCDMSRLVAKACRQMGICDTRLVKR
jgi:hypothetical protein